MTNMTNRLDKPRRANWKRFSLLSLIVLISLASVLLAYVTWRRERGNDILIRALQESNVSFDFESTQDVNWLSRFLGDGRPELVTEISVDYFESETEGVFKRELSDLLKKNRQTGQISRLNFRDAVVEEDASCFFENWQRLEMLQIRDTSFPNSWNSAFANLPALKHVVISGGNCNLEPEVFAGSKSLKVLKLANRGIDSKRLGELKNLLPNVEIVLMGSFDRQFEFAEATGALSVHDEAAYASMKATLDRVHKTLDSFVPPAKNRFHPPATEAQIRTFEHQFGMPLHPSLRALFEIHNGQPNRKDELVMFEKLLSLDESIANTEMERDVSFEKIEIEFEFNPEYDWMNNPCIVGIGSSEADVTYVNNVTGKVYYSYEGMSYTFEKLEHYFEAINDELLAGNYESDQEGNVKLTAHMLEIAKKWRKNRAARSE